MKRTRLPYTQQKGDRWYHVKRQPGKANAVWTPLPGDPAADPEAARLYHRLNSGLPVGEVKPKNTVAALIESYRQSTRWPAKKSTADSYSRTLEKIKAKVGDLDCRRFTRPSIITIRDKLAATSRREADKQVTMYSILFEHAIDKGLITHNPAKGVSRVNEAVEHRPWPEWALDGFRAHADPLTRTIFELALGTAQRLSDVLAMEWAHVEDDGINVIQMKTGADLWVPFTPALRDYLAGVPRSLTFIVHDKGRAVDRHRAQKLLAKVRPLYGGEAYGWHGLRYNAAAEIGDRTDEEVGAITGHKSPQMIRKYTGKGRQRKLARKARG